MVEFASPARRGMEVVVGVERPKAKPPEPEVLVLIDPKPEPELLVFLPQSLLHKF